VSWPAFELNTSRIQVETSTALSVKEGEKAGKIRRTELVRDAYDIIAGKAEGKRLFTRCKKRRENHINAYRKEIGWGVMNWMHLAQDKRTRVGCCDRGDEHLGVIKDEGFLDYCTKLPILKMSYFL
jgi:hypothetical protein